MLTSIEGYDLSSNVAQGRSKIDPQMPRLKLTSGAIERIPCPPRGFELYNDTVVRGLALRVTANGKKSFIINVSKNSRCVRMTLADTSHLTVSQARDLAKEMLGRLAVGDDPREDRRRKKVEAISLQMVLDDFLTTRKNLSRYTRADYRRHVERGGLSIWRHTPVTQITSDMVERQHRILGEHSHAQADQAMRYLRALLNYAEARYERRPGEPLITRNPCRRLTQLRAWFGTRRRRTLVRVDQLRDWFEAVLSLESDDRHPHASDVRDYLILVLMTGLRRSEARNLTWESINLRSRTLHIENTKNGLPHTLPLPDYLFEMLQRRKAVARSTRVFPIADPFKQLQNARRRFGSHFTIHDLRRSFITIAESLDIPAYSLKALLNHKTPDITASYIIIDVERLRQPMQRICDHILSAARLRLGGEAISIQAPAELPLRHGDRAAQATFSVEH